MANCQRESGKPANCKNKVVTAKNRKAMCPECKAWSESTRALRNCQSADRSRRLRQVNHDVMQMEHQDLQTELATVTAIRNYEQDYNTNLMNNILEMQNHAKRLRGLKNQSRANCKHSWTHICPCTCPEACLCKLQA